MRAIQKAKTWQFAGKFLLKNATTKNKAVVGRWTKEQLLDLGPTFVKLGQIVSTRGDLYPLEFCAELESLQDDVPPVAYDDVRRYVNQKHFAWFEEVPFKSASIGQVHRAQLVTGEDVVVKVKRPDIYNIMKSDMDNVKDIVALLERVGIDTGTGTGYVLDESIDNLLGETDYRKEVQNAILFRHNFRKVPWVKVPRIYENLSSPNVIVMEYVPSEKLTDIQTEGVNKKKLCGALINSYVMQTMEHGFFHADPHPGNVGFLPEGRLVFYDFGLVIPINEELKAGFMELLVHIINKDTKKIVETLVALKIIIPIATDLGDIEVFFETILDYLGTLDVKDLMKDEVIANLAREKPFILPTSFIYLAKAFSLVEGTCLKLDPDFNYYTYLEPIVKDKVSEAIDIKGMLKTTSEMPTRIKNISTAVLNLEKSRTAMKRSLDRTQREVRFALYSTLSAILAVEQDDKVLMTMFTLMAAWFALTSRKSR
jgi:ubiquinone biosynthesis protein